MLDIDHVFLELFSFHFSSIQLFCILVSSSSVSIHVCLIQFQFMFVQFSFIRICSINIFKMHIYHEFRSNKARVIQVHIMTTCANIFNTKLVECM